jgi:hypothetical protein
MARKPTGRRPGRPPDKIQYISDIARLVEMRVLVLRGQVADYKQASRLLAPAADPQGCIVSKRSKKRRLQRLYTHYLSQPWFVARVKAAMISPRGLRGLDPFIEMRRVEAEMMQVRENYLEYTRFQKSFTRIMAMMARGTLLSGPAADK